MSKKYQDKDRGTRQREINKKIMISKKKKYKNRETKKVIRKQKETKKSNKKTKRQKAIRRQRETKKAMR